MNTRESMQRRVRILSGLLVAALIVAALIWFTAVQRHHRCLNVCGWQRMWSVTLREELGKGLEGVTPVQMLELNNQRLTVGDLKVPTDEAERILASAQPYLFEAVNTSNATEVRRQAITKFRDISHMLCIEVQAGGTYLLFQGEIIAVCILVVALLAFWYVVASIQEFEKRARDSALRDVVLNGVGCLVNTGDLKIQVASVPLAIELGASFATEVEGTRISDYIELTPEDDSISRLVNTRTNNYPVRLRQMNGDIVLRQFGAKPLDCGQAFVRVSEAEMSVGE